MERPKGMFNGAVIAHDLQDLLDNDIASATMLKCTQNCFMSLKENTLLPTEDRCLRNCFIKSHNFNLYMTKELNYLQRNL